MTAKYFAILTNYGAAQLANAVALGTKLNISVMAVGDGGGALPIPDPAQTKLIRETRRAAVNQVSVDDKNPNYIISEQVIPENEGGWFIREIGLFDDKGGLIAVGNAPETYKPNLQEGSGRTQVIQMVLMVSSTESITLKVDPSVVLATREYVTKSIAAAIQESEARAAKTYQPIGDYVLHPYLKLEMLKKFDKANIAHQLGNDTDKAGSLALLTTELGKKAPSNVADGKLTKDQNGADIPDKPKFIENLGLGEVFQVKGDYADGKIYSKKSDGSAQIKSPSGRTFDISYNAYAGVNDSDGKPIWQFDDKGRLAFGVVPVGRVSGLQQIGIGQKWHSRQDRQQGTTYTNDREIPIAVAVYGIGCNLYVNEVNMAGAYYQTRSTVFAIVPPGASYRCDRQSGISENYLTWAEMY